MPSGIEGVIWPIYFEFLEDTPYNFHTGSPTTVCEGSFLSTSTSAFVVLRIAILAAVRWNLSTLSFDLYFFYDKIGNMFSSIYWLPNALSLPVS
jgi:hypothetical protein